MSSVLFLLEIVAFLIVVYWAYSNDRVRPSLGDKGLLQMVPAERAPEQAAAAAVPKWKKTPARGRPGQAARAASARGAGRPDPAWKRTHNRRR